MTKNIPFVCACISHLTNLYKKTITNKEKRLFY